MDELKALMAGVLGIEESVINDETSRKNTEEWDSFHHLLLISEIESELKVKFTVEEVGLIQTYRDLEDALLKKTGGG